MAIGRISGPLLSKNLLRDGVDLAFETDLLYLDVTDGRIGIRKSNPAYELDVNGTINANNLRVTYTGPGTGSATLGKLTINSGTISTTVGPVTIQPSGNDKINLVGDTTVTGNLHATGNITSDGDITIGDNANIDNVVFNAEIKSNIIPAATGLYTLGNENNSWATTYADTVVANALSSRGNIEITPHGGLLEINSDIRVSGKNPIGTAPVVTNVLYVTMDGNDTNDGRAQDPSRACKTISGAVRSPYYRPGTLIRVSSGHYYENNPILMQPNTAIIGDDLRTTSIEPINKTQDLFHVQSGCYLAQMQFLNGRSGLLPGPYVPGTNRGAFAVAFPPSVNGKKLDVYQSPYIQNCTNQSGPWLIDGTVFVPNQTIQVPTGVGMTQFEANTNTITVTVSEGVIKLGDNVISGPQDPGFFNARTLLLANIPFIEDQAITYINDLVLTATNTNDIGNPFYNFKYEQSKWSRDLGLIIQNIAYDATFGGNQKSVESGLAYYNGVVNLIEGQQTQFTTAINYVNTLSQAIIQNIAVTPVSTATTQVINTALVNGVIASDEINAGISIITNIINNGPGVAPAVFNSCGPENPSVSAEILLQANRTFLQEEVTAYVDAQYPTFEYKKDYCYRDVGLIVDAVSQDIIVGGNTKSIEAALSYFTGSKGDSSVAEQAITSNIELIKNIIVNGSATAPTPISGPNQGTGFSNAADLLTKNKLFLQSEISAYVRTIITLTPQQEALCYRDLGLIVDALSADTGAGGNVNSIYAALQYFSGMTNILPSNEITPLAQALDYMVTLCANIVKNTQNTNLYQKLISQVISLPVASLAEYNSAAANIDLITDIITVGPSAAPTDVPISLSMSTATTAYNAFRILTENKDFLSAEVTGYIDSVFGGGFNYNTGTCFRDTGLIVDSLAFDLLYQGNTQAIFAGSQYYNQSTYTGQIGRELTTTTNAIKYAKMLAELVAVNSTVTNLQAVSTQTFDLSNPGSDISTATIEQLFNTVTNILTNGTVGITNQIISNSTASSDLGIINAFTLVQANKQFIEDEVIAYVDSLNPSFVYDQVKCSRDTGLIVKALAQDLMFSGNSQSTFAGLQYWNQNGYVGAISNELTTTTNAITYIRDLAIKVITLDTSGTRYQTAVGQWTTGTAATIAETQSVYDDFNLILDIITNGTANVTDRIVSNSLTTSTNANVLNAYALLEENKAYLQAEAIAFVEASKAFGFVYDPGKCSRDIGYMVDSISFDLLYGGNRQAIQSGVYYYGFSNTATQVPNEQAQVSAAYDYIKTLASYIVTGQRVPTQYQSIVPQIISATTGTGYQASLINTNIDTIVSIVNGGPTLAGTPSPISLTTSGDIHDINAAMLLDANMAFIQAEVIAYINYLYPTGFTYDRTKCRRDVGYILDCVCFDLLNGGNRQSIQAGVYYYGFNTSSSVLTYEIAQITAAYNHIKTIANNIVQNIPITPTSGNTYSQVTLGSTATIAEAEYIASDIDIITDIINTGDIDFYPKTPISLTASVDANIVATYDLLLANREFIQNELIAYINYYFVQPFVYNKEKCARDTKLIVDSIALDILYEGSSQSSFAALQYWNQSGYTGAIASELTTTTNAIIYAKGLVQSYIVTPDESDQVGHLFDTIVNVITQVTTGTTDLIVPNGLPSPVVSVNNAYAAIIANKSVIQQQTVDYVNATNPGFVYNTSTCYRDVGYIIDCVAFDLLHTGNRQSIQAGVYYFSFNGTSNLVDTVSGNPEIPQSTAAYTYLKYLMKQVLLNNPITRSYQVVYPQVIIPAYMGMATVIPGEQNITVDAIHYLNDLSLNVISNTSVPVVRSSTAQTMYPNFEGGAYAGPGITRNYNTIADIIQNGPNVAPVPFAGSGLFATTGVSSDDVRQSPTVIALSTVTTGTYLVTLSGSTVGDSQNGTLYFGKTEVYPAQDADVPDEWAQRRVDVLGSMGGALVDGAVVSARSPIQSFVFDAYTQVNQGGRGVYVTNNGYAQLVSVFTIFCSTAVQVDNGGICSITNSNSNFGDQCLVAKGYGKLEFSGTVFNPPYPSYQPNGQYYPNGYYPKNGVAEIFLPDTANRPHIGLVMEIEPPLGHINEQGYPGFLNAAPSLATLTTGTITIDGIDTTGIAVGNRVDIRDQYGNTYYVADGTTVVDVNYQSITLNKGLISGGGDPTNSNYFNLYFSGNAYYTVLSSQLSEAYNTGTNATVIPSDQIGPELDALAFLRDSSLGNVLVGASVDPSSITFIDNSINTIISIVGASDLTAARAVVPAPSKVGTPPSGASLAITTINNNIEAIVTATIAHVVTTFPDISLPTGLGAPTDLTTYLTNKCARDIRLVLRQLVYDLETGGNYYSAYAGLSYWIRTGTHHIVDLGEAVNNTALFPDGAIVNFYQRSYISASGYLFEYVGAGTNYGALPQRGVADPVQTKEVIQLNNGKVFFTSTDQNGDFRIGPGLVVSQATGVLSGRTFTKSLFANLTPFILAIEGGG